MCRMHAPLVEAIHIIKAPVLLNLRVTGWLQAGTGTLDRSSPASLSMGYNFRTTEP